LGGPRKKKGGKNPPTPLHRLQEDGAHEQVPQLRIATEDHVMPR
jgi:hypothetical protein